MGRRPDAPLQARLDQEVARALVGFSAHNVVMTLYCYAKMGRKPAGPLQGQTDVAVASKLDEFSPRILWSTRCARMPP